MLSCFLLSSSCSFYLVKTPTQAHNTETALTTDFAPAGTFLRDSMGGGLIFIAGFVGLFLFLQELSFLKLLIFPQM